MTGPLSLDLLPTSSFNEGADESSSMILQGTITSLNAALDGIVYTPTPHFNGISTIELLASDGGASGSGGVLQDNQILDVTITALNDAPTLTLPEAPTINEDASITFSAANNNAIILADDATETESEINLVLTVTYGTLTLGSTDSVTISAGADQLSLLDAQRNSRKYYSRSQWTHIRS